MPQEPKIDISKALIDRPKDSKVKTGAVDISRGLTDARPEPGEMITPEERARRDRLAKQPLTDMTKLRKQVVGGGNVLTKGLVPQEAIAEGMSQFAGIPSPMMQRAAIESEVGKGARPLKAGLMEFISGLQQSVAGGASAATSPAGLSMLHPATAPLGAAAFTAESAGVLGEGIGEAMDDPSRIMQPATMEQVLGGAGGALGAGVGMRPGAVRGAAQSVRETATAAGAVARRAGQEALGVGPSLTERAVAKRNETIARVKERALQETNLNEASMSLRDNVRLTEKTVKADLDARYAKVRETVGDAPLNADPIVGAVETASSQILKGSKENIKVFQEILEEAGAADLGSASIFKGGGFGSRRGGTLSLADLDQAQVRKFAEQIPEARTGIVSQSTTGLSFADAQGFYSELGNKMHGRTTPLPGDVYRAVKHVRQEIGRQLQASADAAGAGSEFKLAQADWHKYESTFHDMRSLARGGSPVARILRAEDPAFAHEPVTGKASARSVAMLNEYKTFGASPDLAVEVLAKNTLLKNMPNPKLPPQINPELLKKVQIEKRIEELRRVTRWDESEMIAAAIFAAKGNIPVALALAAHPIGRRLMAKGIEKVKEPLSRPTVREVESARP